MRWPGCPRLGMMWGYQRVSGHRTCGTIETGRDEDGDEIRAVLFDLDGTLLNSIPLIRHTFEKVFAAWEFPGVKAG